MAVGINNQAAAVGAQFATDPLTGRATGLSLPDGLIAPFSQRSNTLAIVADSITANWRANVGGLNSQRNRMTHGYLTWAMALSNERMAVISDQSAGGSGLTAAFSGTNMLATQMPIAVASGAGNLLFQGGVNDIINDVSFADMKTAANAIIAAAVAANMVVWWCTIPTMNAAYTGYTVARQGQILQWNAWIQHMCSTVYAKRGVMCVDLASASINPTSATAGFISGGSADNLHPLNNVAYYMGKELARVWKLFVPESHKLVSSAADRYGYSAKCNNYIDNPLFAGAAPGTAWATSNSGTGGSATPSTGTITARADGFGNDNVFAISFAAANDSYRIRQNASISDFVQGDQIYAECEVDLSSLVNFREASLIFNITGASGSQTATTMGNSGGVALPEAYTATLRTEVLTVDPATIGAISSALVSIVFTGMGAGSVTAKVGRVSVRKVQL